MTRFLYATAVGVCGALVVHFIIIFALPSSSRQAPWQFISATTQLGEPSELASAGSKAARAAMIHRLDPFMRTLVCRYDLAEGVLHIQAPQTALAWTAGVFDTRGLSFFSLNDRIVANRPIDLVVTGAAQARRVRRAPPAAFADAIVVPSSDRQGFAVIRLFVPDRTWQPVADRIADGLRCQTVSLAF